MGVICYWTVGQLWITTRDYILETWKKRGLDAFTTTKEMVNV
jgi:hypothetical protein